MRRDLLLLMAARARTNHQAPVQPPVNPQPVQMVSASWGQVAGGTMTLDTAPVAGHMLVFFGQAFFGTLVPAGTGWTQAFQGSGTVRLTVYTKIADGTEQTIDVAPSDGNAARRISAAVQEWDGTVAGTITGAGPTSSDGLSTCGPTSAPPSATAVPAFAVAFGSTSITTPSLPAPWATTFAASINSAYPIMTGWRPAPGAAFTVTADAEYNTTAHCGWACVWVEPT